MKGQKILRAGLKYANSMYTKKTDMDHPQSGLR